MSTRLIWFERWRAMATRRRIVARRRASFWALECPTGWWWVRWCSFAPMAYRWVCVRPNRCATIRVFDYYGTSRSTAGRCWYSATMLRGRSRAWWVFCRWHFRRCLRERALFWPVRCRLFRPVWIEMPAACSHRLFDLTHVWTFFRLQPMSPATAGFPCCLPTKLSSQS